MKVELEKTIKYKGRYYSKGEIIEIEDKLLKRFKNHKIISKVPKIDLLNQDISKDLEDTQATSLTEDEKPLKDEIMEITVDDLTKGEIIKILKEENIKFNKRDTKEELFKLLPNEK